MSDTNSGRTNFDMQREMDIRDARDRVVEAAEAMEHTRAEMEEMEDNDCAAYEDKAHTRAVYETACRRVLKAVRALRAVRGEA